MGYKGRTGTHEMLLMTQGLRDLINQGATTDTMQELAIKEGMVTLFQDAMMKVKAGITSLEEALRVVRADSLNL